MNYLENILICIGVPLLLALFFTKGKQRQDLIFLLCGMTVSLLSAYVTRFFMAVYHTDELVTAVEITPVCEELMKFFPFLLWIVIFEPEEEEIVSASILIAVGFATFENICYLAENGAENLYYLFIRGIAAGAMHLCGGVAAGYGLAFVFPRTWLRLIGTAGIMGFCVVFHGIYNLLVTAGGVWQEAGYLFPILCIILVLSIRVIKNHLQNVL